MTLLLCWVVFPLVLGLLAVGCGLLLERLAGLPLPGALIAPVGLAAIVVVAQLLALADATAELATPAVVGLAVVGLGISLAASLRRLEAPPVTAALAVFAVFAAPIVVSGEATFAGYIKLDDTSTFLALIDRVMEHGRSLEGLTPSSYEAALEFNLGSGYPLGSLLPLGIGAALTGQDVAWVFQPYLAVLAAMLALALYALTAWAIDSRALRAAAAFVASQPALLYAYSLWGGVKELATGAALALVAALALELRGARAVVPLAVAAAAAVGIFTLGGAVWLLPALLVVVATRKGNMRALLGLAVLVLVLSLPALFAAAAYLRSPAADSLTSDAVLGNLIQPLSPLQLLGIWPAGDFRLAPDELEATHVLIGITAVAALVGLARAWRRRAWALLLYTASAVFGAVVYGALASPWVAAKAFTVASPAVMLAALVGCAAIFARGRRVEAVVATVAVAGGVVWSNVLAYREVNLAPRDQLSELEAIGERFAGAGPALMTEYQPYGVRHFLRRLDAEGASELRRRLVPLRSGGLLGKAAFADLDEFRLDAILVYRTLVLRRSPTASRPPSIYGLAWRERYYEVWQRPEPGGSSILEHLPLGDSAQPGTRPSCPEVARLARLAGVDRLATVPRRPVIPVVGTDVEVRRPGRYEVWLAGSFRRRIEVAVDGKSVAHVRHRLNNTAQWEPLATVELAAGRHRVTLEPERDLLPGSGGPQFGFGPLALSPAATTADVLYVRPEDARALCGRDLDWIEALSG